MGFVWLFLSLYLSVCAGGVLPAASGAAAATGEPEVKRGGRNLQLTCAQVNHLRKGIKEPPDAKVSFFPIKQLVCKCFSLVVSLVPPSCLCLYHVLCLTWCPSSVFPVSQDLPVPLLFLTLSTLALKNFRATR